MAQNPEFSQPAFRLFPAPPAHDRAFAVFAAPDTELVHLSLTPAEGHQTPASAPSWFRPRFWGGPDEAPWFPSLATLKISRAELLRELNERLNGCPAAGPDDPQAQVPARTWKPRDRARAGFSSDVEALLQEIQAGSLLKAVPIAFLEAENLSCPSDRERLILLRNALLFQQRHGGYLYGWWSADEGSLGVTPELLFERSSENRIHTMALAGTRPLGPGAGPNLGGNEVEHESAQLLQDPKERREHDLVIQGICEQLAPLGELRIGSTAIRRAGSLVHLHTPIELVASASDGATLWQELVERLHPTPALGGHPRAKALQWLENREQSREPCLTAQSRQYFGAPFGVRLEKTELCLVAIRNLHWSRSQGFFRIGAGAGVVAGSTPEKEWREIERKWNAVLKIFDLEP